MSTPLPGDRAVLLFFWRLSDGDISSRHIGPSEGKAGRRQLEAGRMIGRIMEQIDVSSAKMLCACSGESVK